MRAAAPELFVIGRVRQGSLATMARPEGGDRLPGQMRCLAVAGADVLVSLLSDNEVAELGLGAESREARRAGLTFFRLPTPNLSVPDRDATLALAGELLRRLDAGAAVVVHCWAGIGRSSTLAAAVLVLGGATPDSAWARVSAARGRPVPETDTQRAFIGSLCPRG